MLVRQREQSFRDQTISGDVRMVVAGDRDVGLHAVRSGFRRDGVDELTIAAGEDHLMAGAPRHFHDGCADSLTATGNEKTSRFH